MEENLTLYKLIILFMLYKVDGPLSNAQISNCILEKEYTTYFTLQHSLNELESSNLVSTETTINSTLYRITSLGRDTLGFFEHKISDDIKHEVSEYLIENELQIKEDLSVISDYYKTTDGLYAAHLIVRHKEIPQVDLTLTFPTKEQAVAVCENWKKKCDDVYALLMDSLLV
jgi:DNA-binding PadR family transcriptional regulator